MKIKQEVRDKYAILCPFSTMKCENTYELDYKIKRGVELGELAEIKGNELHYQYYYNCFVIKGNKVVDMYKTKERYIEVGERVKREHYNKEFKVVV